MKLNRYRFRVKLAGALVAAAAALVAAPGTASAVPAGSDLFETDPASTELSIPPGPISAGFFGPGSDPFVGNVHFGGVPLNTFGGHGTGDADTVVQRPVAVNPPGTVPIELVALNLVSVNPITVTYNGGQNPERWNVDVNLAPSPPSQGQITINPGTSGGTFDSQLQVVPRLTFTRVSPSDGATQTLDIPPSPATLLQQHGGVWRDGCVLPALAVPGLNDNFCPGETPQGQKVPTLENSLLAQHGVYPAQPNLEHFKCYSTKKPKLKKRTVTLTDQFGTRQAEITKRAELCPPVQKNQEPFQNTAAHLQCYKTTGQAPNKTVAVQNQFGSQQLLVGTPRRLCLPTEKKKGHGKFKPITTPIDHYQCYSVSSQSALFRVGALPAVTLNDQFGKEKNVKVGNPYQLCAPVQKDQTPSQHPVKHLVCYQIKDKAVKKAVKIRNQFETKAIKTKKPVGLCVPSNKLQL